VRALLGIAACLLVAAPGASAAPPPPAGLGVDGGEEVWRASRSFRIFWTNPAISPPIVAVHYRVRDPAGATVAGPVRLPWAARDVDGIQVPPVPGAYVAEVWLEDATGQTSAPASALLRFDDERPGRVEPLVGASWLGRASFPLPVRLSHPARAPLSGIRGYAVSVSTDPERRPCAAVDRCTAAETDLHGGAGGDIYTVSDLPEGRSYLRAVAVSGSGVASLDAGPVLMRVDKTDPTTALHGVPVGWADRPVTVTATAVDGGSGMAPGPDGVEPFTAISVDGATPVSAAGASVTTVIFAEGLHHLAYYARDLAGNVNDGRTSNGIPNRAPDVALVRIDRTPPELSFVGGQDPSAPELIRARIEDALSGPDPSRGWIGVRRRGSGDAYEPLPAVPSPPGELRARWSSETYPDGEYEFRAIGFDRAGNVTATRLRAGGAPMVLPNPLKARTSLSLVLGNETSADEARPGSRLTIRFGEEPLLEGRLVAGSSPLASQPVQLVERYRDGTTRTLSVETAADGGFSTRLAPGPGREVSAVFTGSETLTRAASATVALAVEAQVRLRASARVAKVGGAPIAFTGRVGAAAGTIPTEGKAIQLQFRLAGSPWREFRTIRTDPRGRFRYRYRFSDDDSRGARFLFRVYAPAQGGWPYEPAGSRPVAVRGR
jgi:hypothetical protein